MRYSPSEVLRKYVLRKCIEHLVVTCEHAVWFNLTFWECVTKKEYANKCWNRLRTALVRENRDFRLVGVWARQGRGAWHIHAVCNQRFDIEHLRSMVMRAGFGQQFHVQEIDNKPDSPKKIARYIAGYCTDKNGLDPVKDKGVRRTIFVGPNVKVVNMRYKSFLKKVTSSGRELDKEVGDVMWGAASDVERELGKVGGGKKAWETYPEWYRRNRAYWFRVGWNTLSDEERREIWDCDEFIRRYLETGQWSFV